MFNGIALLTALVMFHLSAISFAPNDTHDKRKPSPISHHLNGPQVIYREIRAAMATGHNRIAATSPTLPSTKSNNRVTRLSS